MVASKVSRLLNTCVLEVSRFWRLNVFTLCQSFLPVYDVAVAILEYFNDVVNSINDLVLE